MPVLAGCDAGWRREADMCYMVSPARMTHDDAVNFCLSYGSELAKLSGANISFLRSLSTAEGMWIALPPNYTMTSTHTIAQDRSTKLQAICWKQASQP